MAPPFEEGEETLANLGCGHLSVARVVVNPASCRNLIDLRRSGILPESYNIGSSGKDAKGRRWTRRRTRAVGSAVGSAVEGVGDEVVGEAQAIH